MSGDDSTSGSGEMGRSSGHRFFRAVSGLTGAAICAQGIAFLAAPILTRIYTPRDFGVLSVFVAIIGIAQVASTIRFERAIPVPAKERTAASLLVLCFVVLVTTTILFSVVLIAGGSRFLAWTNVLDSEMSLWLLPLSLLGIGCYEALSLWAIRHRDYAVVARSYVIRAVGMATVQLGAGCLGLGVNGLILGDVAGRMLGVGTLLRLTKRYFPEGLRQLTVSDVTEAARQYKRWPLLLLPSSLLNSCGAQITPLLVMYFYGPATVGVLLLAERIVGTPLALMGRSVAKVYMGEAAPLLREDPHRARVLFVKLARRLFLFGSLPCLVAAVAGPVTFAYVFGANWGETGRFCRVLVLAYLARFVATPLSQTLTLLGRLDIQFKWDLSRVLFVTVFVMTPALAGAEPLVTVVCYSLAGCTMYSLLAFVSYRGIIQAIAAREEEASMDAGSTRQHGPTPYRKQSTSALSP